MQCWAHGGGVARGRGVVRLLAWVGRCVSEAARFFMVNIVCSKILCFTEVTPLKLDPCVSERAGEVAGLAH